MIAPDVLSNLRRGFANAKRLGSGLQKRPNNAAAISAEEIMALHYIFSREGASIRNVAELGSFLGYTANILADLAPPEATIEIYDMFEHNPTSRESLKSHPLYNDHDFFEIWAENTRRNRRRFDLLKGNIVATARERTGPIDVLFVDIVKHASLVNIMNGVFYDRLRVGGYVLHQDYYHWQSPWLVYQMEHLAESFSLVGDFGNNMSVFVKTQPLTSDQRTFDYIGGLGKSDKYQLMDVAISRYPGLRAGYLMTSKLRLSLNDEEFDSEALFEEIIETYDNERIRGYANVIMSPRYALDDLMW